MCLLQQNVVLFITLASCITQQDPTIQISVSEFQRKMMPCASKTKPTSLCSELEYNHAPSSLSTVEIGQKTVLPSAHYSHKHSRPCHMAAFVLSTHALAVLRTANSLSRHHIHVFAGGNFAHSDFGASIISIIQGNFSSITQHDSPAWSLRHLLIILSFRIGQRPFCFFKMTAYQDYSFLPMPCDGLKKIFSLACF